MEKVSRRINELETIHTNVKLLSEMLEQYSPQTTTDSEREMMKVHFTILTTILEFRFLQLPFLAHLS